MNRMGHPHPPGDRSQNPPPQMNPAELIRHSAPLSPLFHGPDIDNAFGLGRRRNGALPGLVPSRDSSSDTDGSDESLPGLVLSRDSSSGTEGSNESLPGFGDSSSERGSNGSLPDLVDASGQESPASGSLILISLALTRAAVTFPRPSRPQDPHIDYPVPADYPAAETQRIMITMFEGEAGASGE